MVVTLTGCSFSPGFPLFEFLPVFQVRHQINSAEEVFVVGEILDDGTVKGGTGWGAEFAKLCNKPLHVFDQDKKEWFKWNQDRWKKAAPKIRKKRFSGSGTRFLSVDGKKAIAKLFKDSFR